MRQSDVMRVLVGGRRAWRWSAVGALLLGAAAGSGCRRAPPTPVGGARGCWSTHADSTNCLGTRVVCGGSAPCALPSPSAKPPAETGVLSGVIQDGDGEPRAVGGAVVRLFGAGARPEVYETVSDANGWYGFAVPKGTTTLYRADLGDYLAELHAVTLGADGLTMDLQVRHAAFFARYLELAGRKFDAARGIVIIELLDAPRGGVGARIEPRGDAPFVFDAPFGSPKMRAVDSERLLDGGHHFIVYSNVPPGEVTLQLLDGAGLRCEPLAKLDRWPVGPSLITQIDGRCRPL